MSDTDEAYRAEVALFHVFEDLLEKADDNPSTNADLVVDAITDPTNRDAVLRALGIDETALGESITLLTEGQRKADARAEAAEADRDMWRDEAHDLLEDRTNAERIIARVEALRGKWSSAWYAPMFETPAQMAEALTAVLNGDDDE